MGKSALRDVAVSEFVGRKITEVRHMTQKEAEAVGFDSPDCAIVMVLDNGLLMFPQQDPEGNGPGVLCYQNAKGDGGIVF